MKKIILSVLLIFLFSFEITLAKTVEITNIKINHTINKEKSIEEIFNFLAENQKIKIPKSYKHIQVQYKDVIKGSKLENSLKKLIYLDLIKNPKLQLNKNKKLNSWSFYRLTEKIFGLKLNDKKTKKELLKLKTTQNDFETVKRAIEKNGINIKTKSSDKTIKQKIQIFKDVYNTIISGHYNKESIDEGEILDFAIKGITDGTKDKHTVYFPPVESKSFHDSLAGNYEGIGSYVDMLTPGEFKIVSPLPGSPSEKAGLMGGDIVLKIDGKEITKNSSLREVISWVKGPAGTKVKLTIKRKNKIFDIEVTRAKITIKDVDHKQLSTTTYYIQIKSFGENVDKDFKNAIEEINKNPNISKIIIDLRNNGGGYLHKVSNILSYFVPEGEKTAVVKYSSNEKKYYSKGYSLIDFSKYKLFLLQNSGTASASEIMIGTINDYYKNAKTIGTKTYGKGSVQVIKPYIDGSSLKYTVAKWFTGKTETGIDGIGIEPKLELDFDIKAYQKNGFDNQLDKAIFLNK